MPDAPILGGINTVADRDSATDFEKKHAPHIELSSEGDRTLITVIVGWDVPHPNQPDHYITWIEVQAGDAPIARFELSPVVTEPTMSVMALLAPGTTVRALAHCNLHGLWASETAI